MKVGRSAAPRADSAASASTTARLFLTRCCSSRASTRSASRACSRLTTRRRMATTPAMIPPPSTSSATSPAPSCGASTNEPGSPRNRYQAPIMASTKQLTPPAIPPKKVASIRAGNRAIRRSSPPSRGARIQRSAIEPAAASTPSASAGPGRSCGGALSPSFLRCGARPPSSSIPPSPVRAQHGAVMAAASGRIAAPLAPSGRAWDCGGRALDARAAANRGCQSAGFTVIRKS